MPSPPRISVIVAVKNRAATLARCLESVPEGVELLVADGGSTDGSAEIIRRAATRLSWWCSEPDGGVYAAWNKPLHHATGARITQIPATPDRVLAAIRSTTP